MNSDLADMYSADARHHINSPFNPSPAQSLEEDENATAVEYVKCNCVAIYNMYSERGGYMLSRRNLLKTLVDYFGGLLV